MSARPCAAAAVPVAISDDFGTCVAGSVSRSARAAKSLSVATGVLLSMLSEFRPQLHRAKHERFATILVNVHEDLDLAICPFMGVADVEPHVTVIELFTV
jgi:hypothetical protein